MLSYTDIMEGAYTDKHSISKTYQKVAEDSASYKALSPEFLMKKIKKLEEQMYQHACDLEFEEAAQVRDQIQMIQNQSLGFDDTKAG